VSEASNGKTALAGYVQAFERVNGRTPTDEENREALALVDVVRKSNLDPFLVYYLANKKAQDALERVPIETRAVIAEAQKVPADLAARLDHLETLVKRRFPQADPIPQIARYVAVFAGGFLVAETIGMALLNGWLPTVFDRLFTFGCGLTLTAFVLLYLWLAPLVTGKGGRSG
jgi:hypothetical protein